MKAVLLNRRGLEDICFRNFYVVEYELSGGGGTSDHFCGFQGGKAFHTALDDQSFDAAFFVFRPYDCDVTKGTWKSTFAQSENDVVANVFKAGGHAARVQAKFGSVRPKDPRYSPVASFGKKRAFAPLNHRRNGEHDWELWTTLIGFLNRRAPPLASSIHRRCGRGLGRHILRGCRDQKTLPLPFPSQGVLEGSALRIIFNNWGNRAFYPISRGVAGHLCSSEAARLEGNNPGEIRPLFCDCFQVLKLEHNSESSVL